MSEKLLQQLLCEMKADMQGFRAEMNQRFDQVDVDLAVLKGGQKGIRTEITDRFRETDENIGHLNRQINLLDADCYLLLRKTTDTEKEVNRILHNQQ